MPSKQRRINFLEAWRMQRNKTKGLQPDSPEKRLRRLNHYLWASFGCGILASFLFLVAMSTTGWMSMAMPPGTYRNSTHAFLQRQYAGLWKICFVEWDNSTTPILQREYCRMKKFFPSKEVIENDAEIDHGILDYSRSSAAFSVITLLLSAIPNFFTWYSMHEPRYMFKRVAGSLHLVTAGSIYVCIEIFKNSLEYERLHLPARYPARAVLTYGYALYMAGICIAIFIVVGITMFVLSAKRKGEKATSEKEATENEPVIIGRI
jgi:uncharacterized membrane protein